MAGSCCRQERWGLPRAIDTSTLVWSSLQLPSTSLKVAKPRQDGTRCCWVLLEQRARTVTINSLSNFSFLDFYDEGMNMHQLSSEVSPLFAGKTNPHSPLPTGFTGIWLGKGQITSSRSRLIWRHSPLPFYYRIMDYYLLL